METKEPNNPNETKIIIVELIEEVESQDNTSGAAVFGVMAAEVCEARAR